MRTRRYLIPSLLFLLYAILATLGAWFLAGTSFVLVEFVLIALGLTVFIVYLLVSKLNSRAPQAMEASDRGGERVAPAGPPGSLAPPHTGRAATARSKNVCRARARRFRLTFACAAASAACVGAQ